MTRFLLRLSLFAVLLTCATPALAHRPIWGEELGPIEVDDISVSYAFYQELQAGEIDVFYFDVAAGDKLHAGIQIPDIPALASYEVTMALFGPGLPQADEALLPEEHPEDMGALVFPTEVTEDFYEPFTQSYYWGRQQIDMTLPETGTYYLLVWQPEGLPGKYVADIGYREVFTPLDILVFPVWWARVHIYHGHTGNVIALYGLIVIAIGLLVYRRRSRKRPSAPAA